MLVHFKVMCICVLYNFLGCMTLAGTCIFGTTHYNFGKFRAGLLYRVPKNVPDQLKMTLVFKETTLQFVNCSIFLCEPVPPGSEPIQIFCTMSHMQTGL